MNCVILGDHSEIAQGLQTRLLADHWQVEGWNRSTFEKDFHRWDLLLCAIGMVAPVGHWAKVNVNDWAQSVISNCLLPIRLLQQLWPLHNTGASVCFFAGANPNRAGPNYSAYYTGKMALLKAVETIDAETLDAKFFGLAPGIVFTKIHQPTYDSGIVNPGLEERRAKGGTPIQKIYDCLKWCIAQEKETVGGRNICVSDNWGYHDILHERLKANSSLFKLRRIE